MGKRIVITGASGYVGGKLCTAMARHHDVLAIARRPLMLSESADAEGHISCCNIGSEPLAERLESFNADVIVSTTCCYETDPHFLDRTIDANYVFPSEILRIAAHVAGKKKLRFLSLGSSLPSALNLYSLTKKQFNEIAVFFSGLGAIEFTSVDLESFYGEDEPPNRFISRSFELLRRNEPLNLTSGLQHRDYVNIKDVIEVLGFLILTEKPLPSSVPLGSGIAPSVREIIEHLSKITGSRSALNFGAVSARDGEPSTKADLSVLRGLGYAKPFIRWQDGMHEMIRSMK